MNRSRAILHTSLVLVASGVAVAFATSLTANSVSTFYGCVAGNAMVTSITRDIPPACKRGTQLTSWKSEGPPGTLSCCPGGSGCSRRPRRARGSCRAGSSRCALRSR